MGLHGNITAKRRRKKCKKGEIIEVGSSAEEETRSKKQRGNVTNFWNVYSPILSNIQEKNLETDASASGGRCTKTKRKTLTANSTPRKQLNLKANPVERSTLGKDIVPYNKKLHRNVMPPGCTALWNRNRKVFTFLQYNNATWNSNGKFLWCCLDIFVVLHWPYGLEYCYRCWI